MYMVFVVAIILIAGLLYLLDRALKAVERGRRRREVGIRLAAAAREGAEQDKERRAAAEASKALTSVLPAIVLDDEERDPRVV